MTHKLNSDRTAVIAPDVKWIPIDKNTPIGCRMQLIERAQGVAYTRVHHKGDGFTHWFPLPTFEHPKK
jgi:hypothetical protein